MSRDSVIRNRIYDYLEEVAYALALEHNLNERLVNEIVDETMAPLLEKVFYAGYKEGLGE